MKPTIATYISQDDVELDPVPARFMVGARIFDDILACRDAGDWSGMDHLWELLDECMDG